MEMNTHSSAQPARRRSIKLSNGARARPDYSYYLLPDFSPERTSPVPTVSTTARDDEVQGTSGSYFYPTSL
jgi:hypothetical protein